MSLLLSCQSISKSFGAQDLFFGISIAFSKGDRVGLIGPNGSGKSTLLRILAGLIPADEGEVSKKRGVRIAFLSQDGGLDPDASVEQTLLENLSSEAIEETERYSRVQRWMARADFEDPDQKVKMLSGGRRKRLAIISVLIQEPELLLMDEPTVGLDHQSRRHILETVAMLRRKQNLAVLWATHLVDEAEQASRVVVLHHGKILNDGPIDEFIARMETKDLSEAFLKLTAEHDQEEVA